VDLAEEESKGFATGRAHTVDDEAVHLLDAPDVDLADAQHRCHRPDVAEADAGELASPAKSNRDGAERRQEYVAAALRSSETPEAGPPDAAERTDAFRFPKHVLI